MRTKTYRSTDLPLVTYLTLQGMALLDIRPAGPRNSEFVLRDVDSRPGLVLGFLNGQGVVDAGAFIDKLRQLKAAAAESRQNSKSGGLHHA